MLLEVIGHISKEILDHSHHILNCDLHAHLNIYQCKYMKFERSQPNCYIHVQYTYMYHRNLIALNIYYRLQVFIEFPPFVSRLKPNNRQVFTVNTSY